QLGKVALPLAELLAEVGDGEAVDVADLVQLLLLLAESLLFLADALAQPFEVGAALADVGGQLSPGLAQPLAGQGQPFQRRRRLRLEVRHLLSQGVYLGSRRLPLGNDALVIAQQGGLFRLQRRLRRRQAFFRLDQLLHLVAQGRLALFKVGPKSDQLRLVQLQLLSRLAPLPSLFLLPGLFLGASAVERGLRFLMQLGLFVEAALALGQLVVALAELFLQGGEDFLTAGMNGLAFLERLAVAP